MTWFKVDDNLAFHRKVVAAGNAAMGLWVRAGAWSAGYLTDGFVPDHMIAALGSPAQRQKLIAVELWIEVEGGCRFHEWNEKGRQPTAKSVLEARERGAERQAKHRNGTYSPPPSPEEKNNLATTSSKRDERTASGDKRARFTEVSEDPQVDDVCHAVSSPLVTPSVTGVVTPTPTRPDQNQEQEELSLAPLAAAETPPRDTFAEFWDAYPRKQDKRTAEKAWRAALKRGADPDHVIEAARVFARLQSGRERRYIKLPATWLNADAFDNEPEPEPQRIQRSPRDMPDHITGWQALKATGTDDRPALHAINGRKS